MGIFSKTTAAPTKVVKVSAETIGLEIDKLTKSFTTIVTKLNTQAQAAKELKAAKEAEDAKVQKEEDIKNIIHSFGVMLENNYPEFGFKAEELDEETLDGLAAIAIMLLDIEALKHTSTVRVKPAKSNKTFELHKTNSDEVFKDFFKSLGL